MTAEERIWMAVGLAALATALAIPSTSWPCASPVVCIASVAPAAD